MVNVWGQSWETCERDVCGTAWMYVELPCVTVCSSDFLVSLSTVPSILVFTLETCFIWHDALLHDAMSSAFSNAWLLPSTHAFKEELPKLQPLNLDPFTIVSKLGSYNMGKTTVWTTLRLSFTELSLDPHHFTWSLLYHTSIVVYRCLYVLSELPFFPDLPLNTATHVQ